MPQRPSPLLEFRPAYETRVAGSKRMTTPTDSVYFVGDAVIVSDSDYTRIEATARDDALIMRVYLNPQSGARLHDYTSRHIEQRVAVLLRSKLIVAPRIAGPIGGPEGIPPLDLTVRMSHAAAERIVADIRARWPEEPADTTRDRRRGQGVQGRGALTARGGRPGATPGGRDSASPGAPPRARIPSYRGNGSGMSATT